MRTVMLFFSVILVGCATSGLDSEQIMLRPANGYEKVDFKKIVSPAFISDYYDKGVEFTASFNQQQNSVLNVSEPFKTDYLRVIVNDSNSKSFAVGTFTDNVFIPKNKSEILFGASQGDTWKIKAKVIKNIEYSNAGMQGSAYFAVHNIETVETASEKMERIKTEALKKYGK